MRIPSFLIRLLNERVKSLNFPRLLKQTSFPLLRSYHLYPTLLVTSGTFLSYKGDVVDQHPFSISEQIKDTLSMLESLSRSAYKRVQRDIQTSEGSLLLAFVGLNAVVYLAWKVPSFIPFMSRHFTCSLSTVKAGRLHTLMTCNFSHAGFLHLFSNMFLLMHFGSDVCRVISPERFLTLYLAGGLASSLTSLLSKYLLRGDALSLGASGSVMAVMFMYAMLFPNRDVYFFGYPLKAKDACVIWALLDATGLLGNFGRIDFAAHLGGAAFGLCYYEYKKRDIAKDYQQKKLTRYFYGNDIREFQLETRKPSRSIWDVNSGSSSSTIWNQFRSTIHKWDGSQDDGTDR
eukprot:jgi/Galph1/3186/GphlegSOOS_G1869.1